MDAIQLLKRKHRELEDLFEEFARAGAKARPRKEQICQMIGDALAVHALIEERLCYPATRSARTEDDLPASVEEHLAARRILADLLDIEVSDGQLDAEVKGLREQVERHVEEEEQELFARAKWQSGSRLLEQVQEEMEEMEELAEELKDRSEPGMQEQEETARAAHI